MESTEQLSKKDVMKLLLDIMPDEESEMILKAIDYGRIYQVFTDKETREQLIIQINNIIAMHELLLTAINHIPQLVEDKDKLLYDYAINHYDELSRDSKREFCIEMMNKYDFQRDLCDTIIDEVIHKVPELKPIIETLDVKKNRVDKKYSRR